MKLIKLIVNTFMLILIQTKAQQNITKEQPTPRVTDFPKILWTYWDSGYQGAHLFTKLCINNMDYYAKKSGWDFRFLTKQNLTHHISQKGVERVIKMIQTSKHHLSVQHHVDIYRLFLLYENGGMWVDTNSFFVAKLDWIQKIDQQISVYNKISSNPQVITFGFNFYGGNKTWTLNQQKDQEVYLFPGIQIWSMIAKPKSKFINDIILNLERTLATPRNQVDKQNKQIGIVYGYQNDMYFITSNYQFQTVLQKKQKEIQNKPQQYLTKYAVDYYNIWTIEALQSAFALIQLNDWTAGSVIESLFHDSVESYFQRYNVRIRFIKFTSHFYPFVQAFLPYVQFASCISAIDRINPKSIIYEHLFIPNSELPLIKGIIAETNNTSHNSKCSLHSQNQFNQTVLLIILFVIILLALNCGLFYLFKSAQQSDGKEKQHFVKLSVNSDK